jgi:hypothetical protein
MVGLAGRKASNKAFQTDRSHRFNALVDGPDLSMELNSNICYLSTRRGRGMPGSPHGDTAAEAPVSAPPLAACVWQDGDEIIIRARMVGLEAATEDSFGGARIRISTAWGGSMYLTIPIGNVLGKLPHA